MLIKIPDVGKVRKEVARNQDETRMNERRERQIVIREKTRKLGITRSLKGAARLKQRSSRERGLRAKSMTNHHQTGVGP